MLDIVNESVPSPKCYFTHAMLGEHADLMLPDEVYEVIRQELDAAAGKFHYARVYLSLGEIIDGDFFNHYIKTGNVLMISEGRRGIDNVFSLREGTLLL
ncbi:hypothetical protein SLS58_004205 [Diplodia intermedia]|uniref:Uncharacterized protein n=1 Tax=Diplodia intermedia TaxID=856260 RepID=A0ABR3TUC4_9PEZI